MSHPIPGQDYSAAECEEMGHEPETTEVESGMTVGDQITYSDVTHCARCGVQLERYEDEDGGGWQEVPVPKHEHKWVPDPDYSGGYRCDVPGCNAWQEDDDRPDEEQA